MKRLLALLLLLITSPVFAAGEIQLDDEDLTGQTLYVVIKNASGNALTTGTTFATYTTTRADFDQAMTEVGVTGLFAYTFPAVTAGDYKWTVYQDANDDATPSHTDDIALAQGAGWWSGTKFGDNSLDASIAGISVTADARSLVATTIATLASQTSFTLTAGSADNDAYNRKLAVITDSATSTQKCTARIADYVGSTRTVTLMSDPGIFTMAAGDSIAIVADHQLGGPYQTVTVPASRTLIAKDRGDGTFGIAGGKKIRMSAGEGPQWWAIEFAGTGLAAGDELDSMENPTVSGADAAVCSVGDFGPKGTKALVKVSLTGAADSADVINIVVTVTPDGEEEFIVTVPVQVGG